MTMTLEQMADELQAIIDGERPRLNKTEMREYVRDLLDANAAHLAQPAQAVDVAAKDAEIERLSQESAQQFIRARDWAELSGKNEDRASIAESLLATANALLRNIAGCQWFNREAPATVELIDAYLQGVGDEARKTNTR